MHETRGLVDSETVEADIEPCALDASEFELIVGHREQTRIVPLRGRSEITIGRGTDVALQIEDESLSRLHARLVFDRQGVRVTDLGSRNGVRLNGVRVKEASLGPSDVAVLGNTTLSVLARSSARVAALGLLGRELIRHELDDEWRRCRRFRRPLSVAIVRGPARSSMADMAALTCPAALDSDAVGIIADSTLLVLMPETRPSDAVARVTRILDAGSKAGVRLSIGVAAYPETQLTPDALIAGAQAALDTAQKTERASVQVAEPESHVRGAEVLSSVRKNASMLRLQALVERVAPRPIPVLITGETGVGKELVASDLHALSERRDAPLRVVNCAAIPDTLIESVLFGHMRGAFTGADRTRQGVFEQARGGTVFLDEIGEMSPAGQAALLRVLDTRRMTPIGANREVEVDVRVVAATHRDLEAMVREGTFRLDLLHRLNAVVITVPPLRERRDEVRPLAEHFAAIQAEELKVAPRQFSDAAMQRLEAYHWPGNVRELRNAVARAIALVDGDVLTPSDLPAHLLDPDESLELSAITDAPVPSDGRLDLREALQAHEQALIEHALQRTNGNQRRAAWLLSLPLRTLERKVHKYALQNREWRS